MFFCGGTGILPFLDTFAYILRKAVSKFENKHQLFNDEIFDATGSSFKLTVFAYFTK